MTQALALDGHDLARDLYAVIRELHALLRDLDPARWRDELEQTFRARLTEIADAVRRVRDALDPRGGFEALRAPLGELSALIDEATPAVGLPSRVLRREWNALRRRLQDAYEALAQQLKPYDIHAPSLRPTNYTRNLFHVGAGLFAAWLILDVLSPRGMILTSAGLAAMAWTLEISRRRSPRVNAWCMAALGRVAHPHEAHRVNSSTFYVTGLTLLALTSTPLASALAVTVLGVADPAAAIVGRRFGRTRLVNGRSLEGTLAFAGVGAAASAALIALAAPGLAPGAVLALSLGGATCGAITELFSRRIDDNLSIPLAVAAGAGLVIEVMGLTGL